MENINSHIQMPRFLLRNFEDKNHFINYYDICRKEFKTKGHAKSLNTETHYYSPEFEEKLNNDLESPFSKIVKKCINIFSDSNKDDWSKITEPVFNDNEKLICRQFFYLFLAREPSIVYFFVNNSVYSFLLSKTDNNVYTVISVMNLLCGFDFLEEYGIGLSINYTLTPFLLSNFGVVSYYGNDQLHYTLPISPKLAITIHEKEYKESTRTRVFPLRETEQIDFINKQSINLNIGLKQQALNIVD